MNISQFSTFPHKLYSLLLFVIIIIIIIIML